MWTLPRARQLAVAAQRAVEPSSCSPYSFAPRFGLCEYHPWQTRCLLLSSAGLVGCAALCSALGAKNLAMLQLASGLASINYWRAPGPSLRRDVDVAAAAVLSLYGAVSGLRLRGVHNACGWLLFAIAMHCFRRSWFDSLIRGNTAWACWHVGAHVCIGSAAVCLAAGRAEGGPSGAVGTQHQLGPLGLPRNPFAYCVLLCMALEHVPRWSA